MLFIILLLGAFTILSYFCPLLWFYFYLVLFTIVIAYYVYYGYDFVKKWINKRRIIKSDKLNRKLFQKPLE